MPDLKKILKYSLVVVLLSLLGLLIFTTSNIIISAMNEIEKNSFEVNVAKAVHILGIHKYFEWRKEYEAYYVFLYSLVYKNALLPLYNFINNIFLIIFYILMIPVILIGLAIMGYFREILEFGLIYRPYFRRRGFFW